MTLYPRIETAHIYHDLRSRTDVCLLQCSTVMESCIQAFFYKSLFKLV